MERTCSHLIGRLVGELIRGMPKTPEELQCSNWLSNRLFSHGIEDNFTESTFETICGIFIGHETEWIEMLQSTLGTIEMKDEVKGLFSLIVPVALEDHCVSI